MQTRRATSGSLGCKEQRQQQEATGGNGTRCHLSDVLGAGGPYGRRQDSSTAPPTTCQRQQMRATKFVSQQAVHQQRPDDGLLSMHRVVLTARNGTNATASCLNGSTAKQRDVPMSCGAGAPRAEGLEHGVELHAGAQLAAGAAGGGLECEHLVCVRSNAGRQLICQQHLQVRVLAASRMTRSVQLDPAVVGTCATGVAFPSACHC
jgi:hypothetical protein